MMLAWLALIFGVLLFFLGIYGSSRSKWIGALICSAGSILGLAVAMAAILYLMVPGFFAGVF
mgnify:FL=1